MRVASAGVIDREASFICVHMRCARDVLERGRDGRDSVRGRGSVLAN
jgi:hypothetical protein